MRRFWLVTLASLVGFSVPASEATAQAYQCRMPRALSVPANPSARGSPVRQNPVGGYTLALTWSPEFCRNRTRQAAHRMQCSGRNGRFGFVVHGLWPEGRAVATRSTKPHANRAGRRAGQSSRTIAPNWPQWCPTRRRVSTAVARRNLCMMPSVQLMVHEWAKHGSCAARSPHGYFKATRILWNSLHLRDLVPLSRRIEISAGQLRDGFILSNPDWPRSAIGVHVNGRGWLKELQLCYGTDFMPARCDRRKFGVGDTVKLRMARGL